MALLDQPKLRKLGTKSQLFSPAKMKVIAAAEKMFGEQSLAGAPLYRIAEASGQSNRYAVQYHFNDREGLVDAIFAARAELIAERRTELFELAQAQGLHQDLNSLLQCIYLPIAEQIDEQGRHSYIRFVLQYYVRPGANPAHDSRSSPRGGPAEAVYRQLCEVVGLDFSELAARVYYLTFAIYAALLARDREGGDIVPDVSTVLDHMIPLLAASLTQPVPSILGDAGGFAGGSEARA